MPDGDVPPAIMVTRDVFSGSAACCLSEVVRGNIKFIRPSFQDGNNSDHGGLHATRWRLPLLWGAVERTRYDVGILRYELGYNPGLQDRIMEAIRPFYSHGQGIGFGTYTYDEKGRVCKELSDFFVGTSYRKDEREVGPSGSTFAVHFGTWEQYLKTRGSEHVEVLMREWLRRTRLGLDFDLDDYHPWGKPKRMPEQGLWLRLKRWGPANRETSVYGIDINGFESMEDATIVARRILDGFELVHPQTHFSLYGPPDLYDDFRARLNAVAAGWCLYYLGKRRSDVDLYAETHEFGPGTQRWFPLLEWVRGNKHTFVLSVLRFPDGLRLEFSSSCRDNEILKKEIRRVAGPIEVIPVEPGSEFDIE